MKKWNSQEWRNKYLYDFNIKQVAPRVENKKQDNKNLIMKLRRGFDPLALLYMKDKELVSSCCGATLTPLGKCATCKEYKGIKIAE